MTQLPPTNAYEELKKLIDDPSNREHECREYLKYIPDFLVKETVTKYNYTETEYRSNNGDSDYIISANIKDDCGLNIVRAYIWELKAPQCYIFEKDNENRLRPTKELISAENQLLHYVHECKGNEQFREEFGVTHSDNVCFGGIIIGSNSRQVNGDYLQEKKEKLYEKAARIRTEYFFRKIGIRLVTWDTVLDLFKIPIKPRLITSLEDRSKISLSESVAGVISVGNIIWEKVSEK